jgi:hypothetical protein
MLDAAIDGSSEGEERVNAEAEVAVAASMAAPATAAKARAARLLVVKTSSLFFSTMPINHRVTERCLNKLWLFVAQGGQVHV